MLGTQKELTSAETGAKEPKIPNLGNLADKISSYYKEKNPTLEDADTIHENIIKITNAVCAQGEMKKYAALIPHTVITRALFEPISKQPEPSVRVIERVYTSITPQENTILPIVKAQVDTVGEQLKKVEAKRVEVKRVEAREEAALPATEASLRETSSPLDSKKIVPIRLDEPPPMPSIEQKPPTPAPEDAAQTLKEPPPAPSPEPPAQATESIVQALEEPTSAPSEAAEPLSQTAEEAAHSNEPMNLEYPVQTDSLFNTVTLGIIQGVAMLALIAVGGVLSEGVRRMSGGEPTGSLMSNFYDWMRNESRAVHHPDRKWVTKIEAFQEISEAFIENALGMEMGQIQAGVDSGAQFVVKCEDNQGYIYQPEGTWYERTLYAGDVTDEQGKPITLEEKDILWGIKLNQEGQGNAPSKIYLPQSYIEKTQGEINIRLEGIPVKLEIQNPSWRSNIEWISSHVRAVQQHYAAREWNILGRLSNLKRDFLNAVMPKTAEEWNAIAQLYEQKGDNKQAAESYEKAGQWREAGLAYEKSNDYNSAYKVWKKVAESHEKAGNWIEAGRAYEWSNDYKSAYDCFEKMTEEGVAGSIYWIDKIAHKFPEDQVRNTKRKYELAVQQKINDFSTKAHSQNQPSDWRVLARLYSETGEWSQAAKCYEKVKDFVSAYYTYDKVKDTESQYNCAKKIVESEDERFKDWENIFMKNFPKEKVLELRNLRKQIMEPKVIDLSAKAASHSDWEKVAYLYLDLDDYKQAANSFQQREEFSLAAQLYEKMGDHKSAFRCYIKGAEITGSKSYIDKAMEIASSHPEEFPKEELADIRNKYKLTIDAKIKELSSQSEWKKLADLLLNNGEIKQAAEYYEKAEQWYEAFFYYEKAGEYPSAFNCVKKLAEEGFESTLLILSQIRAHLSKEQIEEVKKLYNQALDTKIQKLKR